MAKQYGLIIPGKSNISAPVLQRPSIFNNDSDSDEEIKKPTGFTKTVKRQVTYKNYAQSEIFYDNLSQDRLVQQQALAEDPTIFQYDELYDDMDTKRKESKLVRKDLDKKPKYISKLLVTAERRKRENERRIERQVQKEREEEGNQFKDKEEFVTSAYKKKLEELKELEEAEKREEYLESIGDVRKQGDLSGFYRHLYEQKVNYEDKKENEIKVEAKTEEKSRSSSPQEAMELAKKVTGKRKYRKRDDSTSEEDGKEDTEVKKLEHLPSNLDADSDFSIDSEDSDAEETAKKPKLTTEIDKENQPAKEKTIEENLLNDKSSIVDKEVMEKDTNGKTGEKMKDEEMEKDKKPKINIWKKRTVGEIFDDALKRYFERKALHKV